jgi:hypothetical protein
MSKDLVKRGDLERRIERWLRGHATTPGEASPPYAPRHTEARMTWAVPNNLPPLSAESVEIELPRTCARTSKLWTALYLRRPGEKYFEYLRSNVAESWRLTTYATPEKWGTVPSNLRLGIELCPHCGAYTMDGSVGSVWCGACRMFVCYGLTSPQGYFICAYGHRGQLENGAPRGNGIG